MTRTFFKCKRSGNLVSFTNENDIAGLRKHEGYTEVLDNAEAPKTIETITQTPPIKEVLKLRGRPRKVDTPEWASLGD